MHIFLRAPWKKYFGVKQTATNIRKKPTLVSCQMTSLSHWPREHLFSSTTTTVTPSSVIPALSFQGQPHIKATNKHGNGGRKIELPRDGRWAHFPGIFFWELRLLSSIQFDPVRPWSAVPKPHKWVSQPCSSIPNLPLVPHWLPVCPWPFDLTQTQLCARHQGNGSLLTLSSAKQLLPGLHGQASLQTFYCK